jgi:hypothetical protein
MLILAVAANTSFSGFPRVVAILADDSFLPRQLSNLGDRLVYNNGILLLAIITGILIVIFNGDTHALIPLFAVGVFLAFTLSQTGMVVHWQREKGKAWHWKILANGLGALATMITLLVVGISKFREGAWLTILLIPLMVHFFYQIKKHYREIRGQLSIAGILPFASTAEPSRAVIPVSGIHRGMIDAVNFARASFDHVTALYIEVEPDSGEKMRQQWEKWWPDVEFIIRPSMYRSVVGPLLDYLDEDDRNHQDGQLAAVVLPEIVPSKWWHHLLHNQSAALIKNALLYRRRRYGYQRIIIDVPYHLNR